jgi:hypothetical protein
MSAGGIITAFAVGEGILVWRSVTKNKRPPLPGEILSTSGVFVLLGLLHEGAPMVATYLAWGLDLAAFMNLYPTVNTAPASGAVAGGAAAAAKAGA